MNLNYYLNIKVIILFLFITLLSIISGYIASTGQALFVVIFSGIFLAFILLNKPLALFFMTLVMTLVIAGSVKFFISGFDKIWWIAYGMSALLFLPAMLSLFRKQEVTGGGAMYMPLVLFFVVIIFSSILSKPPLFQIIVAIKSIFFFGAIWAFLASYAISNKVVRLVLLMLLVIALVQVFPVLYQYLFVRSERLLQVSGKVSASDSVVGTFGGSKDGGGLTAVLGFYLVIVIVVMLSFFKDNLLSKLQLLKLLPFLIIPLLLIEVKAIFVFIPIGLFVLYRKEIIKSPFKAFLWSVGLFLFLALVLLSYQMFHWNVTGRGFVENIVHAFLYTFKESTGYLQTIAGDISRRQAFEVWFDAHRSGYGVEALLGHGLGSSKTSGMFPGEMAIAFAPLNIDKVGVVVALWDIGILGVVAVMLIFVFNYRNAGLVAQSQQLEPWKRSLAKGLQAVVVLFLVAFFYRNDIPYAAPMMFLLMLCFGLISWLMVQKKQSDFESKLK